MNNLLDDDREEVACFMTTLLPVLNTTELEEVEDTNNRTKGGIPKNTISKKIDIRIFLPLLSLTKLLQRIMRKIRTVQKKVRRGRFNEKVKEVHALRNVPSNIKTKRKQLIRSFKVEIFFL